jgi:hypothetical protein
MVMKKASGGDSPLRQGAGMWHPTFCNPENPSVGMQNFEINNFFCNVCVNACELVCLLVCLFSKTLVVVVVDYFILPTKYASEMYPSMKNKEF